MNTQEKNRNQMIISSSSVAGIVLLSLVMSISLLLEQVFTVYASENQDTLSVLQTQKIQLMEQNQNNSSNLPALNSSSLQVPSLPTSSANVLNKIFKQTQDWRTNNYDSPTG